MATLIDALEISAREGCGFIMLKNQKFTLVDEEDLEWMEHWHWANVGRYVHGWPLNECGGGKSPIRMHRAILRPPSDAIIDHRNRDPLDNRKGNLRVCNQSQNMANSVYSKRAPGASRYRGVTVQYRKSGKCWLVHSSEKYLGIFYSEIEAARAYDAWVLKKYGEFANINGV